MAPVLPLALCIQPACLQHKYIRHPNSSHIFERPERIRAVLLGIAAALSRLETEDALARALDSATPASPGGEDLASMLSGLSIGSSSPFLPPLHAHIISPPPLPSSPGQILMHHPALQLAHSPPVEAPFPYLPMTRGAAIPSSTYLRDLYKWASNAVETIKNTGCEIPDDMGLNPGDLYLGPGSIVAIEGSIQTVCQAVDGVCGSTTPSRPSTPVNSSPGSPSSTKPLPEFTKAFCAIRPPGHHCGEDAPSGFCYVNNVVVGALHGYLQHDIDRAIIIDFDLHHGNGTQALVMPHNAASYAEDLAVKAGKPPQMRGPKGARRGWKAFYGSVHDIYSYPCEDGDLELVKDASVSLAAHGQYIENIHLQPYASEEDFYERIYPKYLTLLERALVFMKETEADPERTILFISAGFDACEHEHQGMQRHDRRVPVSFYSRYTRDLAAFADKHTMGKVVSVLEGGYGDRALTSAAMGHAIGLLGQEGVPSWWGVDELVLLERAAKKRRRGKLCALGPELASNPHLARTHALLAHMEGSAPPETPAPSTNATPQARMTLRTRRQATPEEDSSAPSSTTRRPRAKPNVTPTPTPLRKGASEAASEVPVQLVSKPAGASVKAVTELPAELPPAVKVISKVEFAPVTVPAIPDLIVKDDTLDVYPSPAPSAPSPTTPIESPRNSTPPTSSEAATERIVLRIPRLTPSSSPPAEDRGLIDSGNLAAHVSSSTSASIASPTVVPPVPRVVGPSVPAQLLNHRAAAATAPTPRPMTFRPGAMEPVLLPPSPARPPLHSTTPQTWQHSQPHPSYPRPFAPQQDYAQPQPPFTQPMYPHQQYQMAQYPLQPPSSGALYPSLPVPTVPVLPAAPRLQTMGTGVNGAPQRDGAPAYVDRDATTNATVPPDPAPRTGHHVQNT